MHSRLTPPPFFQLLSGSHQDRITKLSPRRDGRTTSENQDDGYLRDEVQDGAAEHSVRRHYLPPLSLSPRRSR